ncbi:leukotriene A-4 hydrolase-like isoform X2 [Temnothorax curvispinosus]|uniref:Leukotriene A-4 hydrolase-like isoform X2 n=1 Tax=Temnothorax curvispinosus TaxID=300111 RepID=A0A6J1QEV6_9HYME|nr:leukotriene A-4 hydrolase-like isoform X2 [Temnothorax curvispinosus]
MLEIVMLLEVHFAYSYHKLLILHITLCKYKIFLEKFNLLKIIYVRIDYPQYDTFRCKIQIVYKTSPTSPALYWLTREQTTDSRHPFLLSNNKLIYARSWFPCQDTPSVKFEYSAKIFVQKNFRVLMSALLQRIYDAGPELDIHEFHQNKSVSSYAVIIAVGSLLEIKLDARINIFAERNLIFSEGSSRFVKNILKLRRSAQKLLNAAESLCGPYLWGIYDICVLPPSIAHFEIECPCVTFISPTLLGGDDCYMSPLARNISQSWAGNLVTCSNYEHLWLNKSLSIFTYRKIGCIMYLNYEEMNEFFQREDLRNLSMQIKNFENRGLLKCLIPNLTGMSPHKATKYVPYEWGCKLLHHLESILGGSAEFEKFLKYYFRSFAYRSINTIDWINCLYQYFPHKKRILDCVEWYLWLFNITSPFIVPRESILEIHCFRLALDWEPENSDIIVNNRNFQLIANEFCDVERIIFLIYHTFKTNLTKEELRSMTPIFAFNIRNVEIRLNDRRQHRFIVMHDDNFCWRIKK